MTLRIFPRPTLQKVYGKDMTTYGDHHFSACMLAAVSMHIAALHWKHIHMHHGALRPALLMGGLGPIEHDSPE